MKDARPRPPKHISREARRLWQEIFDATETDAGSLVVLNLLAEAFDRMRQAQDQIRKEGLTVTEKTAAGVEKIRAHPLLGVERDARGQMLRAYRTLGLDLVPPEGR